MKNALALALPFVLAATATLSTPARASKELAQKYACMACHAVDRKVIGPAYAEVIKKYASQSDAQAMLAASILKGSTGKWGPVPMPAQASMSEADAKALAGWVLGGAK